MSRSKPKARKARVMPGLKADRPATNSLRTHVWNKYELARSGDFIRLSTGTKLWLEWISQDPADARALDSLTSCVRAYLQLGDGRAIELIGRYLTACLDGGVPPPDPERLKVIEAYRCAAARRAAWLESADLVPPTIREVHEYLGVSPAQTPEKSRDVVVRRMLKEMRLPVEKESPRSNKLGR